MEIAFNDSLKHPASFKDPSGFVFNEKGIYYRQVNRSYSADYDMLISSGLYGELLEKKLILPHTEVVQKSIAPADCYKVLLPEQLGFISYPYEWSFDQLKDAALLTLRVARIALKKGMMLKDATPFNVQFHKGSPVFIDTLSFEKVDPSKPWIAYRQFCETFLFPLLLEHYRQIDVQKWLSVYLEGIPVKTVASLLPAKSRFNMGVWLHVFLQNKISATAQKSNKPHPNFNTDKFLRLLNHLKWMIKGFNIKSSIKTTWNNYYDETILSQGYLKAKESVFLDMTEDIKNTSVLDLGCNDGYFSKLIAQNNPGLIAADFDSQCINRLYKELKQNKQTNILPLCIDISNPPPATGFRNAERQSFVQRIQVGLVVALALIHHLVLSKNIPLENVALQLSELSRKWLIIEFVPLQDEKSQQLIANKTHFHQPYDVPAFEESFGAYFEILKKTTIPGTDRILYKMKKLSS